TRADHRLDAPRLDRPRHVLTRGANAEVRPGDEDCVVAELVAERRVEALEQIGLHQLGVLDVQVLAREHDVGVDVRARDDDAARPARGAGGAPAPPGPAPPPASAGCPPPPPAPPRPLKSRFAVVTAFPPAPSTPTPPPNHAPQVGGETTPPASTKTSSRPSPI